MFLVTKAYLEQDYSDALECRFLHDSGNIWSHLKD